MAHVHVLQDVLLRPSGLLEGMTDDVCCVVAPVCRVPCEKARAVDLSAARENVTWGVRCAASVCLRLAACTAMESRTRNFFMFGARDGEHLSIRMVGASAQPTSRPGRTAIRNTIIHTG